MAVSKRIVLHFPRSCADQPIIYHLVKDYGLMLNILKASISPNEEGLLVLELSGDRESYEKGVRYLADIGVSIQPLSRDVYRNDARCTHCGACVTVCPSGAFAVDPVSRKIKFLDKKCMVCGMCIRACPPRAMEMRI
jgi:L-aspartate semialdehyde sulfurtransferase ferredoxin